MSTIELEIQRLHALRTIQSCLLRLKWLAAATRFEIAMHRHYWALKAGFNPEQPRDEYGRWTDTNGNVAPPRRNQLPGKIPSGDPPEIPKERPPTSRGRTTALKAAARFGGPIGKIIEAAEWIREHSPLVEAYRDPPKSLEELQRDVSAPGLGYDIHHIVEQTQAENDGFTREQIDSTENLVRIPRMKHWEINGWYQTENPAFGGETPREYLSGRSWEVKRAVGLEALRNAGVLKP
jgi:hypothetical protein